MNAEAITQFVTTKCPEVGALLRDGVVSHQEALRLAALNPNQRAAAMVAAKKTAKVQAKPVPVPPPAEPPREPAPPPIAPVPPVREAPPAHAPIKAAPLGPPALAPAPVVVTAPAELVSPTNLETWSTADLRRELARGIEVTAEHLRRLAAIWRELERRGEDLTSLRKGLAFYLPLIAADKVDAYLVSRFAGSGELLRIAATLPVEVQRELALEDAAVPLWAPSGETFYRSPLDLNKLHIRQIFSDTGVRSAEEQRAWLEARKRPPRPLPCASVQIPQRCHEALLRRAQAESRTVGDLLVWALQKAGILEE